MASVPKARDDLEYFEREVDGDDVVFVRDPVRGAYYKYNVLQAAMLRALDGRRTPGEIAAILSEQFEVEIPPEAAERFIVRAREHMLLDITSYDVTPEAARKQVRRELHKAGFRARGTATLDAAPRPLSTESARFAEALRQLDLGHPRAAASYLAEILAANPDNLRARQLYDLVQTAYIRAAGGLMEFPSLVLFNPLRLLTWLSRTIGGFLFSWRGMALLLAYFAAGTYAYSQVSFDTSSLGALDVGIAITLNVLGTLFHEVGHGLACQHYGGKVTEIGFLLFYNIKPAAYCDTSSSYVITNRHHKVIVQMAGSLASLVLISTESILLAVLNPDLPIYQGIVLSVVLETTFAFITLIPFMKFDGYYATCDYLNLPNLRDRAFKLTRAWLARRLLGIEAPTEALPPRTHGLMIAYAIISFGFTAAFIYIAYFHMLAPLVEHFRGAGLAFAVLVSTYFLRNLTVKPLWGIGRILVRERRRVFTRKRGAMWLGIAALVTLPWCYRRPVTVDEHFVIVPHERVIVRAQTTGRVDAIFVSEGDSVARGAPLARLRNPALTARIAGLEAELAIANHQRILVQQGARSEELALARTRLQRAQSQLAETSRQASLARTLARARVGTQDHVNLVGGQAAARAGTAGAARGALSLLEAGSRQEAIAVAEAEYAGIASQLEHLRREAELLVLRSPIAGVVATPRLEEQLQVTLQPGDAFAEVHDLSRVHAEIALAPSEPLDELTTGDAIVLRAVTTPGHEVETRIARFREPAAGGASPARLVVITEPFVLTRPLAGLSGHARLYGTERTLAYAYLYLPAKRLVSVKLWQLW